MTDRKTPHVNASNIVLHYTTIVRGIRIFLFQFTSHVLLKNPLTPNLFFHQDVLFGRGFTISSHPGNRHLRSVVQAHKPAFLKLIKAKKAEKRNIARRIVDEIQELDPPGRFLIEDPNSSVNAGGSDREQGVLDKEWIPVETEKAVDKV